MSLSADETYRLLVSVGNPQHVEQLMRTARDLAGARGGEIVVLSVVVKSRESPFALMTDEVIKRDFSGRRQEIHDRAVEMVSGTDVPVTGEVRVGSDLSKSILRAIDDHDADAALLGWDERPRADFVFGSTVDRVVHRADCDVLVEKIGAEADGVESVLVPTTGSPHATFAAEVAGTIAAANDARVEVVHVVPPGEDVPDVDDLFDETVASVGDAEVRTRVVEHRDVADAIVSLTDEHDVTVVGATRDGPFQRFVFGAIPRVVGTRASGTVIMTKRYRDVPSRLSSWVARVTPS
ncbi:universal stress protein [Haloarculaceae archaeon H-GB11]|nr:universal stress protein [Haloarculaceae archaeon H-GB11]